MLWVLVCVHDSPCAPDQSWKVLERYQSLVTTTVFRDYQSINIAILIIFQSASVLIVTLITYRALSTSTPSLAVRTNSNHYTGFLEKVKQQKKSCCFYTTAPKIIIMNQSGAAARFATCFRVGSRFSMVLCMLSEFRSPSIHCCKGNYYDFYVSSNRISSISSKSSVIKISSNWPSSSS